jgi:hypothetical protein
MSKLYQIKNEKDYIRLTKYANSQTKIDNMYWTVYWNERWECWSLTCGYDPLFSRLK